ncbi:MAG: hypothetical protein PHN63_04885, partial [Candidatus Omnitrophica bacterium]|nr:hypothetical protein [Candidatus Omnitrophota bacterium]
YFFALPGSIKALVLVPSGANMLTHSLYNVYAVWSGRPLLMAEPLPQRRQKYPQDIEDELKKLQAEWKIYFDKEMTIATRKVSPAEWPRFQREYVGKCDPIMGTIIRKMVERGMVGSITDLTNDIAARVEQAEMDGFDKVANEEGKRLGLRVNKKAQKAGAKEKICTYTYYAMASKWLSQFAMDTAEPETKARLNEELKKTSEAGRAIFKARGMVGNFRPGFYTLLAHAYLDEKRYRDVIILVSEYIMSQEVLDDATAFDAMILLASAYLGIGEYDESRSVMEQLERSGILGEEGKIVAQSALANLYINYLAQIQPNLIQRAVDMLEKDIEQLEKAHDAATMVRYATDEVITNCYKDLMAAHILIATPDSLRRSLRISEQALARGHDHNRLVSQMRIRALSKLCAVLVDQGDREAAGPYLDELMAYSSPAQSGEAGEVNDFVDLYIEYLRGNVEDPESALKNGYDIVKKRSFVIGLQYAGILLHAGKTDAARRVLAETFDLCSRAAAGGTDVYSMISEQLLTLSPRALSAILALSEECLGNPDLWQDFTPEAIVEMSDFVFWREGQQKEGLGILARIRDALADRNISAEEKEKLKAMLCRCYDYMPTATASFVEYFTEQSADQALGREFDSFVRRDLSPRTLAVGYPWRNKPKDSNVRYWNQEAALKYIEYEANGKIPTMLNIALDDLLVQRRRGPGVEIAEALFDLNDNDPVPALEANLAAANQISRMAGRQAITSDTILFILTAALNYHHGLGTGSRMTDASQQFASGIFKVFDSKYRPFIDMVVKSAMASDSAEVKEGVLGSCSDIYNMLGRLAEQANDHAKAIDYYSNSPGIMSFVVRGLSGVANPSELLPVVRYATALFSSQEKADRDKALTIFTQLAAVTDIFAGTVDPDTADPKEIGDLIALIGDVRLHLVLDILAASEDMRSVTRKLLIRYHRRVLSDSALNIFAEFFAGVSRMLGERDVFTQTIPALLDIVSGRREVSKSYLFTAALILQLAAESYLAEGDKGEAGRIMGSLDEMIEKSKKGDSDDMLLLEANQMILRGSYADAITLLQNGLEAIESTSAVYPVVRLYCAAACALNGDEETARGMSRDALLKTVEGMTSRSRAAIEADMQQRYPLMIAMSPGKTKSVISRLLTAELLNSENGGLSVDTAQMVVYILKAAASEDDFIGMLGYFRSLEAGETAVGDSTPEAKRVAMIARLALSGPQHIIAQAGEAIHRASVSPKVHRKVRSALEEVDKENFSAMKRDGVIAFLGLSIALGRYGFAVERADNAFKRLGQDEAILDMRRRAKTALESSAVMDKEYNNCNFGAARSAAQAVLGINPEDPAAASMVRNVAVFDRAMEQIGTGDLDGAASDINAAENDRVKTRAVKEVAVLKAAITAVDTALNENRFKAAREALDKVVGARPLGMKMSAELGFIRRLSDKIAAIESSTRDKLTLITGNGDNGEANVEEIFNTARELMEYPEMRNAAFSAVIERSLLEFNKVGQREGQTITAIRKGYKDAMNIARIVYELYEYEPAQRELSRARSLISHAMANTWTPELLDDLFIVEANLR